MDTIGKRLKNLIDNCKGLTINELATKLGFDANTIRAIVNGKTLHPKANLLIALCDFFQVTTDWLLLGKGEPSPSPTATDDVALLVKENENLKERITILEQKLSKINLPKKAKATFGGFSLGF